MHHAKPLQVLSGQANLHRKLYLNELLQHRQPKSPSKGFSWLVQIQCAQQNLEDTPSETPQGRLHNNQLNVRSSSQSPHRTTIRTFSPTTSSVGGAGPSTQASASAIATPEITKTATDTSKSATPTALEDNHLSLNLTLTRG